jgi:hypothetical protein
MSQSNGVKSRLTWIRLYGETKDLVLFVAIVAYPIRLLESGGSGTRRREQTGYATAVDVL